MLILKRNTTKCPNDKEDLHWQQVHGMRLVREITPDKPKHTYHVYHAKCVKCGEYFEVKK